MLFGMLGDQFDDGQDSHNLFLVRNSILMMGRVPMDFSVLRNLFHDEVRFFLQTQRCVVDESNAM